MLLAGDVGGTKTHLGIFAPGDPRAPLADATFPSADYPSLEALALAFLAQAGLRVERACFGVAGPVVGGQAAITNLPWVLQEERLRAALGVRWVRLINDLTALAHAVPGLGPGDLHTLNARAPARGGAIAVIAPGTGLGEAYLTWDGARYRAHPSEGGHTDFAPNTALEVELLQYLQRRLEHVSYEQVCSGRGIPNLYAFLRASGHTREPAWLAAQLAAAEDPTPVIVSAATGGAEGCEICVATIELFIGILGAEAGNLALKVLATGGVYLGGGIPPRILSALQEGGLMQAFQRKGRLAELLSAMPVHVILNPKATLLGAAQHGMEA